MTFTDWAGDCLQIEESTAIIEGEETPILEVDTNDTIIHLTVDMARDLITVLERFVESAKEQ